MEKQGVNGISIVRGHPFPTPHIQLQLWQCNSDSVFATPTVAMQLQLCRHNSLRLPSPRHPPRCTHLAYLLYSPFPRLPSIYSCHP
jgi:hypothetical protein